MSKFAYPLVAMMQVRNQNLSVKMEAFFPKPVPFDPAFLRAVATSALDKFGEIGLLRSGQISQRFGDQLFDYELCFPLFNGQAQFRLGAEQLFVSLQNARGEGDARVVLDSLFRAAQCVGVNAICRINIQAASHAVFENEAACDSFFAALANPADGIVDGGRIVFVREEGWVSPVRLLVERSVAYKGGAFLVISTERSSTVDLETLKQIADTFSRSVQKVGLELTLE